MINKNLEKKIKYMLLVFILFSFLIDSGGDFGLRLVGILTMSFLILLALISGRYLREININYEVTAYYFVMCLSFLPGFLISFINGNEILDGAKWFISFYFVMPILILFHEFEIRKIIDATIMAGILYGLTQLLLLSLMFVDSELSLSVINYFQSNASGWIKLKDTFGVTHPYVYLQATLSLVPIAVLALYRGKSNSFFLLLLILVVAQSRFGVITLVLFFSFYHLNSRRINLTLINLIYCIPLVIFSLVF